MLAVYEYAINVCQPFFLFFPLSESTQDTCVYMNSYYINIVYDCI